jgi:hypothetical protein
VTDTQREPATTTTATHDAITDDAITDDPITDGSIADDVVTDVEAAAVGELSWVDPRALVVGVNVRREANLDRHFVRDIAGRGAREPIPVRRRPEDGALVVRKGKRRTLAAIEAGLGRVRVTLREPSSTFCRAVRRSWPQRRRAVVRGRSESRAGRRAYMRSGRVPDRHGTPSPLVLRLLKGPRRARG